MKGKKDEFIQILNLFFVENGYKKKGRSWCKEVDDSFITIQAQWSSIFKGYYFNIGIWYRIDDNISKLKPKIDDCHLISRLERVAKVNVMQDFEKMTVEEIKDNSTVFIDVFQNTVFSEVDHFCNSEYMNKNFPNNFDHSVWWTQNIREQDLIEYFAGKVNLPK